MPYAPRLFTAFTEADLTSGNISHGAMFTLPHVATVSFSVLDNDDNLSGDFFDFSLDRHGQTAAITSGDTDIGNGHRIYAERSFEVTDEHGNTYTLLEIEQEGSHVDYFTFVGMVPPAGATLTVGEAHDVAHVAYDQLGAGDLTQNIVTIASKSDDFNILVKALVAADLVGTVQGLDDVTVFAPTDAAFTQLAVDLGFDGDTTDEDAVFGAIVAALTELAADDNPIPLLTDILLYHVSGSALTAADIAASATVSTLAGAPITPNGATLGDLEPDIDDPTIVIPDIQATNGIVQAIDRVLLPLDIPGNTMPNNIVDIATGSDDFNILVKALVAADLVGTVQGLDDVTVFAPTDAAFTQLAVDLGFDGDTTDEDAVFGAIVAALTELAADDNPIPLLTDILLYHVSGSTLTAADIAASATVSTLAGAPITPNGATLGDLEPDIDDPTIVIPDIQATNGIVQAIDRVLLPLDIPGNTPDPVPAPTQTLAGIVGASGGTFDADATDFDLLLNALQITGLTVPLDDPAGDFTVFAPNDAAFVALAQTLGFQGSDEGGAFGFLVDALTLLGGGADPLPLLSTILQYHVAPGALDSTQVLSATTIPTLIGADLGVDGASLVDADPDLTNPNIIAVDIPAINGFAHVIDGVLLPVDVLPSNGADDVDFIIDGDDRGTFFTGLDDDFVSGKGGNDRLILGKGDDVGLGGDGNDGLFGQNGDDTLDGGAGNDRLFGQHGDDMLNGGSGNDRIVGASGDDMLDGGDGRDRIFGGGGDDTLTGGNGADSFVFGGRFGDDIITDFEIGLDLIELRGPLHFDDISNQITDTTDGALIEVGNNSITVQGITANQLSADDFLF